MFRALQLPTPFVKVVMAGAAERDLVLGRLGGRILASAHALGADVVLVELANRATYFALTIVNPTAVVNGAVRFQLLS